MPVPVISIIGLPNVGKSTLFNRILGSRQAIVDETPGVTRDRMYRAADWAGRDFYLIDTGGFLPFDKSRINIAVMEQAQIALEESDLVLYMIDSESGPMPDDFELAEIIRRSKRNVILIVNKMDDTDEFPDINEYYKLGLGNPIAVSARAGRNIGDMLDIIIENLPDSTAVTEELKGIKIALLGRPNVGKSSIVNVLLGQEKHIVHDQPGTTRDSIDSHLKHHGEDFVLIDTAGLRKKAKIQDSLEYYTLLRTVKSIERADVALLLIDAKENLSNQDMKIAAQVLEIYKPLIIVVNKWDLIRGKDTAEYANEIYDEAPELKAYPVFFTSALTKRRLGNLLPLVKKVYEEYSKRIETSELNDIILRELRRTPPPAVGGKFINFYYVTQYKVRPPSFMFSCNKPEIIDPTYLRFIVNRIRTHYGFKGSPVKLKFKRRGKKHA
ncbi:MAG: ribosome biogenesis GTPase Der [candidate division Zixibacteria bacterium]|nr:ribosome biogenesis GTPase Der [candidate division Zixibacteria bacterium]